MKHTKGPWEAHWSPNKEHWEIGNYSTYNPHAFVPKRAHETGVRGLEPSETEANARLIAAAPELLEAAEFAAAMSPGFKTAPGVTAKLKAAIAKVKVGP